MAFATLAGIVAAFGAIITFCIVLRMAGPRARFTREDLLFNAWAVGPYLLLLATAFFARKHRTAARVALIGTGVIVFLSLLAVLGISGGRSSTSAIGLLFLPIWQWGAAGILAIVAGIVAGAKASP